MPRSIASSRSEVGRSDDGRDNRENAPSERFKPPRIPPASRKPQSKKPLQQVVDDFWASFNSKTPGKISTVLPDNYHTKRLAQRPDADEGTHNAVDSYQEAVRICEQKVAKIVKECKRINQKYRDPHFDIEQDFYQTNYPDCLKGLVEKKNDAKLEPKSVKRVHAIFEKPQFYIAGPTANDVRQGRNGDCWLMSALGTVSNCKGLIEKICVARDEMVGVYGFVFHRDGAWISEVVDDKLYLMNDDFYDRDDRNDPKGLISNWIQIQDRRDIEKEYRKRFQKGSRALYFAQCSDPNETWLPLLEKAFAKAHGDYLAVEGGFVGEAIEDLTGGVTSELHGTDILDRDAFWKNELSRVNEQFLFGCGQSRGYDDDRNGIQHRHAYSIMEAREVDDKRLVKLRNPWGNTEWTGAWSDGSEEWTSYWLDKLGHKFGDDGIFWISYDDLLNNYQHFDRTRLFDDSWHVTQQWIRLQIPWSIDYHDTYFAMEVEKTGPVVIVLSQLDDRYFRGLEGQYTFTLHFRLHEKGESDYVVRSPSSYNMRRSVSTEVDLEPGSYTVMVKIVATFSPFKLPAEDVVRAASRNRREKLISIGLSHDLAHAKIQVQEHDKLETELQAKQRRAERRAEAKKTQELFKKAKRKHKEMAKKHNERREAKRKALLPDKPAEQESRDEVEKPDAKEEETVANEGEGKAPDELVVEPSGEASSPQEAVVMSEKAEASAQETMAEPDKAQSPNDETVALPEPANPDEQVVTTTPMPPAPPTASPKSAADVKPTPPADPLRLPFRGPLSRQPTDIDPTNGDSDPRRRQSSFMPPPPPGFGPPTRQPTFGSNPFNEGPGGPVGDEVDDDELSWDSELDAPWDSDDERVVARKLTMQENVPPPPPDADDDEFAGDPWNAVCVVGLRVYAKADNKVTVDVVRPGLDEPKDTQAGEVKELDRDDPAADQAEQGAPT